MKHDAIVRLKELALELGRTPSRREFEREKQGRSMLESFGGFTQMCHAAGLEISKKIKPVEDPDKLLNKYKSLCSRKEQIQGFFRHVLDLKELFNRAGNPPVLKLIAQPDTHAKFADKRAVNVFVSFMEHYKPDVHLILGDFVDAEGLSHWPSDDLAPRRIVPELKTARDLLSRMGTATPTTSTRLYLTGNHEAWIGQALNRMPELFDGLAELDIEINLKTLLALNKYGYELFDVNHLVQIGKAHFTHGIYAGSAHAKKHMSVFKSNIYYGHLHDIQEYGETSMDGPMEAASLGCLCRLDAKFLKGKPNNWVHAFGVFEFFPDGTYTRYTPQIINGRMAYNGQVFIG